MLVNKTGMISNLKELITKWSTHTINTQKMKCYEGNEQNAVILKKQGET